MEADSLQLLDTKIQDPLKRLKLEQDSDRLSSMHDSILHHILSFLPTKYVVQTSILAKRWQNLWISLPNLYFDDDSIYGANVEERNRFTRNRFTGTRFTNFVDKVLWSRDTSSIKKFQLSCTDNCDDSHFDTWISAAVRGGVQELELNAQMCLIFRLPSYLFTCHSLVALKLSFFLLKLPNYFCFPNLKIMHLSTLVVGNNFSHQLLNCPNLENLVLNHCINDKSIQSLWTLQDLISDDHSLEILSKLNDANIDFSKFKCEDHGHGLSKIIRVLSKVKVLRLSYSSISLLQSKRYLLDNLPTFHNLKHLELTLLIDGDAARCITFLLQCSPNIESLHIKFYNLDSWLYQDWENELCPSHCVPRNLKFIRIDELCGIKKHVELVRSFLDNAQALEKFIIHLSGEGSEEPILLRQKLLELPRLSVTCVFDITL